MSYQMRKVIPCISCGESPAIARKLCRSCYNAADYRGELDSFPILGPEDVFESRIDKSGSCWLWTGAKNGYGYGIFLMPGERPVRAHRYAWERVNGPIADGLVVMHSCDNPPCVNPAHLSLGTKADNSRDAAAKRRTKSGERHWNCRLSDSDIAAIISSTLRQCDLADRYGVDRSHISRIKRGLVRK